MNIVLNLELIKTQRQQLDFTNEDMAQALSLSSAEKYLRREKGVYNFKAVELPILAKKLKLTLNELFIVLK